MLLAQVDQLGLAHYRKIKMDFYDQMFFLQSFNIYIRLLSFFMLSNINQNSVCSIFCSPTFLFEKFADIFKMLGTSQAFVWMDDTQNSGPKNA